MLANTMLMPRSISLPFSFPFLLPLSLSSISPVFNPSPLSLLLILLSLRFPHYLHRYSRSSSVTSSKLQPLFVTFVLSVTIFRRSGDLFPYSSSHCKRNGIIRHATPFISILPKSFPACDHLGWFWICLLFIVQTSPQEFSSKFLFPLPFNHLLSRLPPFRLVLDWIFHLLSHPYLFQIFLFLLFVHLFSLPARHHLGWSWTEIYSMMPSPSPSVRRSIPPPPPFARISTSSQSSKDSTLSLINKEFQEHPAVIVCPLLSHLIRCVWPPLLLPPRGLLVVLTPRLTLLVPIINFFLVLPAPSSNSHYHP